MKRHLSLLLAVVAFLALCIFSLSHKFSTSSVTFAATSHEFAKGDTISGEIEAVVEDGKADWRMLYYLKTGDETLLLHFPKRLKQDLRTGMSVSVGGVRSGKDVTVDSLVTQDSGGSSTLSNSQNAIATLSNTTGEQKVLVILVNFQDDTSQPFTTAQAADVTFNTTSNYYREASYGQTWLTGDVYGWFTIPVSSTNCDTTAIANYAQQAATKAGASLRAYSHYVYAFPQTSACSFTGRGSVGGNPSQMWVNGWYELGIVGHEFGHNLGLYHSRSLDCGDTVIGNNCTINEYGDNFDLMGGSSSAHFNSYQKERLGWLNAGASPPIQTVSVSGTYLVDAYETVGTNPKSLKILKSIDPVSGARTWYYIEHRSAVGFDSDISNYPNMASGVAVHTGADANPQDTYLLDMTPATTSWYDPALVTGQSFTDPNSGLTITTVSADSNGASVQVSIGTPICTRALPTVSISPGQSQWLRSGSTFSYTVSVTNNDAVGCGASSFNLQSGAPAGWSASLPSQAVSVSPGSTASVTLSATSPLGTADGNYGVTVSAANSSDTSFSSSASAGYLIVSSLNVAAVSSSSSYTRSQTAIVTASVAALGAPVAGASVTFTMTKPNGSIVTQTASTGSNGTAWFSYSFNKRKDPTGTYQLRAVSAANGVSGSGSTSFSVTK